MDAEKVIQRRWNGDAKEKSGIAKFIIGKKETNVELKDFPTFWAVSEMVNAAYNAGAKDGVRRCLSVVNKAACDMGKIADE